MLCRRFGVAPATGYKWLARYAERGLAGLEERSRRPHRSPCRSEPGVEAAVLAVRAQHPAWGGRKIRARLLQAGAEMAPAPSTITAILRRHGEPVGAHGGGRADWTRFEQPRPNALWQMDHKGHVAMADGRRLHPLTVLDDHSRYALVLKACTDQRTGSVREALVEAFRRYGLPEAIITDNGAPWGNGPGQPFTPLGVFLIDQGIRIAHARPYHPQTMGKDERFHRTLKLEAMGGPPFADAPAAQKVFERWRAIYNHERPHEALDLRPPASRYQPSPRSYRETPEPIDYARKTRSAPFRMADGSPSKASPAASHTPSRAGPWPCAPPKPTAATTSSTGIRRSQRWTSQTSNANLNLSTMSPNRCLPSLRSEHRGGRGAQNSSVTVTGAWSEGLSQPRTSRLTCAPAIVPSRSGVVQTWSRRRPLSAADQSGER